MACAAADGRFFVLSYHDVHYDVRGKVDDSQSIVSASNLARHFQWLADHDYTPVSMQRLLQAANAGEPLPERPVLITFDDGYRSFYEIVFPLLESYGYPAVLALVTDWLEVPYGSNVAYGSEFRPREDFLDWEQVRLLQRSSLVEIASHSHDLHRGVVGNPQGNVQPAATTRSYQAGRYEAQEAYLERVGSDLERSADIIENRTGLRPRVMVWPFGAHTSETIELIRRGGMQAALTLEPGTGHIDQPYRIPRLYISGNPDIGDFARLMNQYFDRPVVKRSLRIGLDSLNGLDEADSEVRLGKLLDHVKELGINTAIVQGFHDSDGGGIADAVYFPNRVLATRSDRLNRVIWQLRTRAGIRWIYVWMPVEYQHLQEAEILILFEDLGRATHPTGLFFELPDTGEIGAGSQKLREWHRAASSASVDLRMAVGIELKRRDMTSGTLAGRVAEESLDADEFFLVLADDVSRSLPDDRAIERFLGAIAENPVSIADFVFEVPLSSTGDDMESAIATARAMVAAGAAGIGIFPEHLTINETMMEAFRDTLSLRDHPYRP